MIKLLKTMLLVTLLCLPGCGVIQDYELERLSELCDGYEDLKKVWVESGTPRATCMDGTTVSSDQMEDI